MYLLSLVAFANIVPVSEGFAGMWQKLNIVHCHTTQCIGLFILHMSYNPFLPCTLCTVLTNITHIFYFVYYITLIYYIKDIFFFN